jgi:hypothetical protein
VDLIKNPPSILVIVQEFIVIYLLFTPPAILIVVVLNLAVPDFKVVHGTKNKAAVASALPGRIILQAEKLTLDLTKSLL